MTQSRVARARRGMSLFEVATTPDWKFLRIRGFGRKSLAALRAAVPYRGDTLAGHLYPSQVFRAGDVLAFHSDRDISVSHNVFEPLAGHAGDCAKVTTATVLGKTDAPCSCSSKAVAVSTERL